ncbi:DUF5714 domain-containing protein [Thomasclavelia spiroformis]|uniref:DUF5714 domain-containing protein n=1 Tax=Thomasclavelia spiroformis TaxID=29348 RepID=UPI002942924A|nr:DUF5714 domain-containing protein [Thomasclavelia spiroformis]
MIILKKMMSMSFCHMHGPERHIMIGTALLMAYKNADGNIDLNKAFLEMYSRGKDVLESACRVAISIECICQLL